ncbi:hypothetical protein ZOD2009_08644 [Haladaptatus paucihalophilus DX253]|nr:PKD domain-containing protein [Haladaptatus paucihalophilus]EFW92925.1 hypothetical protein ZOD2009_08644 [Haladaptatus paucihalophilus DX253]
MNRVVSSTIVLLLLTTTFLPSVTTANEPPLADAGLDQHVARGSTVLLDATGSHDPDGYVEGYEWTIETPGNRTIEPNCPSCPQTRFRPNTVGTYTVSVTVTDEDGTKSRDSLYITVSPGESPTVDVSGSRTPFVGQQTVYSATIDAGSASLDHIVWSLDGTAIATDSLSGAKDVDTITRTFPNTGTRTVTATVYDTDGQTDTDSIDLSVRSNGSPPPSSSTAQKYTPTVAGDSLITGTAPFRGTYRLKSIPTPNQIRSVRWFGDGVRLASGRTLTTDWKAGDHSLYAAVSYSDGSHDIARFSDGTTTVVADPKPTIDLPSLDSYGAVSGRTTATDPYGNLQSVRVQLGGKRIGHTKMDATSPGAMQRHRSVSFDTRDFKVGKKYTLSVTAVDFHGQKSTLKRTITPAKMPKIIQSGFVKNDVDSYDERIDPKRYTAHHVTKIDLNGVDPSDVKFHFTTKHEKKLIKLSGEESVNGDILSINTLWAGSTPKNYDIVQNINIENPNSGNSEWFYEEKHFLHVNPSPPEIRLSVIRDGGTGYRPTNLGMVVDAGDSFDPDGSELRYIWKQGANPITPDNTTAKFSSVELAGLEVRDGYNKSASVNSHFLNYFAPEIKNVELLSDGPYKPNETIRLRVTTERYKFSKNSYHLRYDLGISIEGASGSITDWQKDKITKRSLKENFHGTDPRYYTGIVELPASQLFRKNDTVKVRVYNEERPETYNEIEIPDVEVMRRYGQFWTNPRIKSTEYFVNRPTYDWKLATSPEKRDRYLSKGYSVDQKSRDGFEYSLEERKKVRDAKYEDVDRSFSTELQQSAFLQGHPNWWSTGRKAEKYTYTTTEHEWHDSKSGRGRFTGETRRVQVHPAQYRTLKQFAHEHEVTKTGTRTVRKTKQVEVTKTDTKYVMQCRPNGICFEVPEQYTYTTTVSRTYTTTETYTYTVTETDTYWSYQKFNFDDYYTGEQKRVKVEDAEYDTEYRFEYSERHTGVDYTYGVQTREKVRDAQYEWQEQSTTTKRDVAMSFARNSDWRIGSYRPNVKWSLKKRTGTETKTVDQYLESDTVVMTYVTAKVDLVRQYVTEGGEIQNNTVGEKIVDESFQNLLTDSDLRTQLKHHRDQRENGCNGETNCMT